MVFDTFGGCEKAGKVIKEDGKVGRWESSIDMGQGDCTVTAPGLVTSKELRVYYFCYSIMDNL